MALAVWISACVLTAGAGFVAVNHDGFDRDEGDCRAEGGFMGGAASCGECEARGGPTGGYARCGEHRADGRVRVRVG